MSRAEQHAHYVAPYIGRVTGAAFVAMIAFIVEAKKFTVPEELRTLIGLVVNVGEVLTPGHPGFFDYMRTMVTMRRVELLIPDLQAVWLAIRSGGLSAGDTETLHGEAPVNRLGELAKLAAARTATQETQVAPHVMPQVGQAMPLGLTLFGPGAATLPLQNKEADPARPAPEMSIQADPPGAAIHQVNQEPHHIPPDSTDQPIALVVIQGVKTMSIQTEEKVSAVRLALRKIREFYRVDDIQSGLIEFLPAGADPGKIGAPMLEAAELKGELKLLTAQMKTREAELSLEVTGANEAERKKSLFRLLKNDAEYQDLVTKHAVTDQASGIAETQAEIARYQLRALGHLTDLVGMQLLVLDMQPAIANEPQQAQVA